MVGQSEIAGGGGVKVCKSLRSVIFSIKNFWKFSQREGDGVRGEASRGCMRELKILNRTWGLWLFMETVLEM